MEKNKGVPQLASDATRATGSVRSGGEYGGLAKKSAGTSAEDDKNLVNSTLAANNSSNGYSLVKWLQFYQSY